MALATALPWLFKTTPLIDCAKTLAGNNAAMTTATLEMLFIIHHYRYVIMYQLCFNCYNVSSVNRRMSFILFCNSMFKVR